MSGMAEIHRAAKNELRGKLLPETRLRGYVIDSVLGYGGFGIVYRAHHEELGYSVALKEFLPAELSVREGSSVRPRSPDCSEHFEDGKRRFLEEARQLVQFRADSGVITCLDFFRANGTAYFVMEHVEGLSLAELLGRREKAGDPLDEKQMVSVVVPLLETLSRVHAAGVLHRDIKPSNILIRREDGMPVLIDFGAAKQTAAQHSKSLAPFTEGYAAIEQVGGGDLGAWTDIYGLGAVMWRIVAGGNPPWNPPNPVSVVRRMNAHVRDESDPLPSAIAIGEDNFPHRVLQAIDKCLRIQEADRFQTCKELLDLLQRDQLTDSESEQKPIIEKEPTERRHSHDLEMPTKISSRNRSMWYRFRNWVRSRLTSSGLDQADVSSLPRVNDVRIVNSPTNSYAYSVGEVIYIRVGFTAQIETVGAPRLALRVGSHLRQATCWGYGRVRKDYYRPWLPQLIDEERNRHCEGRHALLFRYFVHAEDAAVDGIGIAADALTLNGGSIRSVGGGSAILDLGSCAIVEDPSSRVDGSTPTSPRVSGVEVLSRPSHGSTYRAGETIFIGVQFNTWIVAVSSTTKLNVRVGNVTRNAHRRASLGTWAIFQYLVRADDIAKDGICIGADPLFINGGSIRGIGGTSAVLDLGGHALKRFSKHKVNGGIAAAPEVCRLHVFSRPSDGTAYGAGEEIKVSVDFSVPLEVTGSPHLALEIGGLNCQAGFSSKTFASLSFKYLVKAEDLDDDGLSVSRSALTLNGGSIRSIQRVGGISAVLDLGSHAFKRNSNHKINGSIATAPEVRDVQVSSRPSNGTAYGAGEEIKVWVEFGVPLKVTGSPQLALSVGNHLRQARYSVSSVSGSSLWFAYRVQTEDAAPGGIAVAADALSLNGGCIRSLAAAPAVLDLRTHAFKRNSKHKVNGNISTAPKVRDVQVSGRPSNGTAYGAGEEIEIEVEFDLPVKVTGSPQLALQMGGRKCQAALSSSWGLKLSFTYLIQAQDAAPGGIAVAANALSLNGGCISSVAGAPAVLDLGAHAFKRDSKHKVDGSIATVPQVERLWVSSRPSNGTAYGAGEEIKVCVAFDLPLKVTGSPRLALQMGGRKCQATLSRSWGLTLSFTYLVQAQDAAPGGIAVAANALSLNGGCISSVAGAPAVLDLGAHAFKRDSKHKVDGSIATVPHVKRLGVSSRPSNGTAYGAGEEIEVEVDFDLPVKVTGSPQLALQMGGRKCQAALSFLGRWFRPLSFLYRVQAKDAAPGGIAVTADAISLNGGCIRSLAATPAVLDLGTHAFKQDSKHKVNGDILTAPKVRDVQVSGRPSNGTAYGAGEEIKVEVDFDLPVKVTGSPQLALQMGSRKCQAALSSSSGSWSRGLSFTYLVQAEDSAPGGIAVAADALSLNGGCIRSLAAASAVLDLGAHAFKRHSKHKVDGSIATVPQVRLLSVLSSPSNGTAYGAGEEINVCVDFDLPLKVTGSPQLALTVGNHLRRARCSVSSVSGSSLWFNYRVQTEDAAPGGIAVAADALSLNGGSVRSLAAAPAVLDLGTHAFGRNSMHKVSGSILTNPKVRGRGGPQRSLERHHLRSRRGDQSSGRLRPAAQGRRKPAIGTQRGRSTATGPFPLLVELSKRILP